MLSGCVRRRSAAGKGHSGAAAAAVGGGGNNSVGESSIATSSQSGVKLSVAMSSTGRDDAATPDAVSSAGASAAAATSSVGTVTTDDATVNTDAASVEPGAMSAAGQHWPFIHTVDSCWYMTGDWMTVILVCFFCRSVHYVFDLSISLCMSTYMHSPVEAFYNWLSVNF